MECPELDRLINFVQGRPEPGLKAHLKTCESCQADLRALIILPLVWEPGVEVTEELINGVMEQLPTRNPAPVDTGVTWGQKAATGLLGFLTGGVSVGVLGSSAFPDPWVMLVLSLLTGGTAVVLQARAHPQDP